MIQLVVVFVAVVEEVEMVGGWDLRIWMDRHCHYDDDDGGGGSCERCCYGRCVYVGWDLDRRLLGRILDGTGGR